MNGWEDFQEKAFEDWKNSNKVHGGHEFIPSYRECDDHHFRFLFGYSTIGFEAAPHLQRGFNVYT
jgi:hypothetical protein